MTRTKAYKRNPVDSALAPPLSLPKSLVPQKRPAPPPVDTLPLSKEQCAKALKALVSHALSKIEESAHDDLLAGEDEEKVFLVVSLKRQSGHAKHKPIRL
jgi:hypothetical protein